MAEKRTIRYAHLVGWGKSVPAKILTNTELAHLVNTSDEWIQTRTGIQQRHIAKAQETTATLAIAAAKEAIECSGLDPSAIDLIIVATATPDYSFPATACLVQDALGADQAGAFDLSAGCTGFIYALAQASQAIACGAHNLVLVIGAETLSRIVDWTQRDTCVLFGDGAGAVLLQGREDPGGVLGTLVRADGSGSDLLKLPAGGSYQPATRDTVDARLHYIHMNGRAVFKFAARAIGQAITAVSAQSGLALADIDLLIPHQANRRIIETAAEQLEINLDKFFINIEQYGNTSAASIPIALCDAVQAGKIQPGHRLVLVGFGAGLTWGAVALEWERQPMPRHTWQDHLHNAWHYLEAKLRSRARRLRRRLEDWAFGNPVLTNIG